MKLNHTFGKTHIYARRAMESAEVRAHLLDLLVCFYSNPEGVVNSFSIPKDRFDTYLYELMVVQFS